MLTGLVLLAFVVAGLVGIYFCIYADGRPARVRRCRPDARRAARLQEGRALHPGLRRRR